MMEKFTVTINYHGNYGYIEYDPDTKSAAVHLGVEEPIWRSPTRLRFVWVPPSGILRK